MIQRVQSLFLLAVSLLMIAFLFLPIWKKEVQQTGESISIAKSTDKVILNAFKISYVRAASMKDGNIVAQKLAEKSTVYIAVLAILASLTALISIFQFKNRLRQMKLGFLNSLLMSAVLASIFLGINSGDDLLTEAGNEEFLIGFYMPIIALLLNLLANRFIKKDEELVRSVDRIR